mmetsp:Transcript_16406/g.29645  ORF Transcript_16406/g.29645 Transcript_16406/m.29645 type:complete len:82 (+) Transcript_16406:49-294(+)
MASPFEKQLKMFLDSTKCRGEMDVYQDCLKTASSKKKMQKCKELYRKFMFCVTDLEEDRLQRDLKLEQFKQKWGHYPNETD